MKTLILTLILFVSLVSCKESSVKPKVCYECEFTRVRTFKNSVSHFKPEIVHSKFKECDMSYNQLIENYNYVSEGDNIKLVQTTFCKISSN